MASYNKNSSNRLVVPEAQEAMNKFKMEAANEVGVNLKEGYNGHLTSREAGSVGGQMVKTPSNKLINRSMQIKRGRQQPSSFCLVDI